MSEVRRIPNGPKGGRYMGPREKFDKNSFKRLFAYMKKYKVMFAVVVISILVSSVVQVLSQLFLKSLIDDYIVPLLNSDSANYENLIRFILQMGALYVVGVVCCFIYNRIMIYVSQGILKDIRDDMFNKMETLPISYFDDNSAGDIMSRYTNDTDTLRQMISQSIPALIGTVFSITAIFISMLYLSPFLTAIVLAGIIIMIKVTKKVASLSADYFVKQQESIGDLNGYIEEMITGQKVIKVFTHEDEAKMGFDKLNEEVCYNSSMANGYGNIIGPISNNMGNLIYVVIAFVGGVMAIRTDAFTIGAIASFLSLTKSFSMPISQVTQQFNSIVMALAGVKRIFELIDEKGEENNGKVVLVNAKKENGKLVQCKDYTGLWAWKKGSTLIELRGDVRLKDVSFSYVKGKEVLHDISLYAKPGQKIAFVGATGAGKTTITNLLNRFYDIDSGVITYDGIDIKEINKNDLRTSLGMVLQDTNLFTGTIMDNIRYGREDATDEECIEASKISNADKFIRMLPNGYDTVITGNGANLSQGQRQLLTIARCAVANPPVMILDEATSSIDTRTEKIVQDGMDKLMNNRTVFVIAHRLSTVKNAKAIMVLENGKIIERGEHDELIKEKGKYYRLYTGSLELE